MGYDDNTPLKGVTGRRDARRNLARGDAVRVHDGMQPQPLPMLIPEPKAPPAGSYAPSPNVMTDGQSRRQCRSPAVRAALHARR